MYDGAVHRCPTCHRRVAGGAACPRDGSPAPVAPADDAPAAEPPAIEGYTLGAPLGAGGFAVVWAARRSPDGAAAAIKVGRHDDAVFAARFEREAEALLRVGPPHAPALYGRGRLADGRPYLVMERLAGATLAAEIAARDAPVSADEACALGDAVLAALEAAHARGVIHRDLKPENVFVTWSGGGVGQASPRATLLDFGLTKAAARDDAGLTRTGVVVGTSEYMAPEQLRGDRSLDARADLYAFGVMLFELLTLRLPFVGDMRSVEHGHLALRPPRPSTLAEVPEAIEELVLACLAKDPLRRPSSTTSLRCALAAARGVAPPSGADARGPRSSSKAASLMTEGRQPVVLLVVEVAQAATPVVSVILAHRGFLARQRGRRYVGIYSGLHVDDPTGAALSAARELVERHGARAALHLAPVAIRWKERGAPSVFGATVDRPETWMPREPWAGIALSDDLARLAPQRDPVTAQARVEESGEVSVGTSLPFLGRRDELDAIGASVAEVFGSGQPGLFTLIGGPGLGKSRMAGRALSLARAVSAEARVILLVGSHAAATGASSLTARLLERALLAPEIPPADARAFCVARLGEQLGDEAWPTVAAALGWTGPAGAAPAGEHRQALMRVVAAALRRMAEESPVAVILDDAHLADDALLDALEYATLVGERCPLWVFVTAAPRFEVARPSWGARTERRARRALAPLDPASAAEIAAHLLAPAEYPPAAVLQRIAEWSGNNPLCLTEIVLSLKRAGIVRQRAGTGSFYVSTAEFDRIPPSPAWQWLAARQLEGLSPELAAFVRLCSVLGNDFSADELEAVQDALDREGLAGTPVDVGFGLSALVGSSVLQRGADGRYAFQNALVHDAIYELLDAAQRSAIHRTALACCRARLDPAAPAVDVLAAIARHAGACGAREEAADAHLRLADRALAKHRHVEADQHYTAALALLPEGDARRARGLAGRGKSRYLVWRTGEAVSDLAEARALAAATGDRELTASVLLEEATALDWQEKFEESAQRAEEAAGILASIEPPSLEPRLLVAKGRTSWRRCTDLGRGSIAEAITQLEEAVNAARTQGDYEAHAIGLLLLAWGLAWSGQLTRAEVCFEEVLALTRDAEDWTHHGVAYWNRTTLWITKRMPERAIEDLRIAIELAREIGHPAMEGHTTHNVALLLYWSGRAAEAVPLARRALWLEERFADRPTGRCALLLARILLVLDQNEEAVRLVAGVAATCLPDRRDLTAYAGFELVRLSLPEGVPGASSSRETWDSLAALAEDATIMVEERLELLYWRARSALRGGRRGEAEQALEHARPLLVDCTLWGRHFDNLTSGAETVQALAHAG